MKRIAVLGSGAGSNFQALLDAQLEAEISIVISDQPQAGILDKARKANIETQIAKTSQKICEILTSKNIDLVCLAGYMRLVKEPLLSTFQQRILNIHPSLLPAYPGLKAWKQAVDDRAIISGCTVHYVDEGMDTGEVILQKSVPVFPEDTPKTLHARIQVEEHQAYPEAVRLVLSRL